LEKIYKKFNSGFGSGSSSSVIRLVGTKLYFLQNLANLDFCVFLFHEKPLHRLKSYLAKPRQKYFLKNIFKDCTLTQVQTSNQQQFKIRNVPNEVPMTNELINSH